MHIPWEQVWSWASNFGTIYAIVLFAISLWAVVRGVGPVLWRLGRALSQRKIAIFAKYDARTSLENLIGASGIFRSKNIIGVPDLSSIAFVKNAGIFLIYWPDWGEDIEKVLDAKSDDVALIIYAPVGHNIPDPLLNKIDLEYTNVSVCSVRGRLLNDIVTAMITIGYEKR